MTETEAKWTERIREWEKSGLPLDRFVEGKPYRASTLLWRKRQLQRRQRLERAPLRRGGTVAGRDKRRDTKVGGADQRLMRNSTPITMATVLRKPALGQESVAVVIEIGIARIKVASGCDMALLKDIVRALQGAA